MRSYVPLGRLLRITLATRTPSGSLVRGRSIAVATINFFNLMFNARRPTGACQWYWPLFAAEFRCGFGVMMLDISIGAIFAAVIPDTLRSRVTGAFQAANCGVAGFFLLLPTPLPRYKMPGTGQG